MGHHSKKINVKPWVHLRTQRGQVPSTMDELKLATHDAHVLL